MLLDNLAKMDMTVGLMIINTERMVAVKKPALSALKRSFNFFHGKFASSFWFLSIYEEKNRKG